MEKVVATIAFHFHFRLSSLQGRKSGGETKWQKRSILFPHKRPARDDARSLLVKNQFPCEPTTANCLTLTTILE